VTVGSTTIERHSWSIPGVMRVAVQSPPTNLQPILSANTTDVMIDRLAFDPLITVSADGKKLIPILAATVPTLENGGISKDGLTITYKLRHNVKWHDGAPFTSADVKFSWQALMNPANNVSSRSGYNLVRSIDTPDPYTAIFHLTQKFAPAVTTFFSESDTPFFIVPKHLLGSLPNINNAPENVNPVGTGPFKFKKYVRADRIEFVRNDDYFMGKPKLKEVVVRIIPDENTSLNELRSHEIDWIFEASPQLYGQLKMLPNVKTLLVQQNQYLGLLMNLRNPILSDVQVRRAIAYAIDKQTLVNNVTFGSALVADDEHPPFMWAYVGGKTYPYDPAKAKALLAADGWTPGPGGILRKDGKRLSLVLSTNTSNVTRRTAVVQIQSYLKAIGIDASVKSYLGVQMFAPLGLGGILASGKFDLNVSGWIAGLDPDDSVLYMCRSFPPNGNNYSHICSQQLDAAENVALTHYDIPTRKKAYAAVQQILFEQMPDDYLWWPRQLQPISVDFKGFDPNPVNEAWNCWEWSI
jgi:peptide/nickel transport system substrate-binding protein